VLAGLTGHGVDVEAVDAGAGDVRALTRALKNRDLRKIDGVVLLVDADVLRSGGEAVVRLHRLLVQLWDRVVPASSITVAVAPTSDGRAGVVPPAVVEQLCAGSAGLTRLVELDAPPATSAPRERYAALGAPIATAVAESVVEPIVWSEPVEELDERRRSAAVRQLGPLDADWEASLQRLVRDAARAYGAQSAAVTVLDGPQALYLAGKAVGVRSVPREQTICETALRTYGGVLVGDAQSQTAFQDLPLVRSGAVRFYAGHRIDNPDGVPLAVLCVFDPEPRSVRGQDITLLRDFAHLAERLIRDHQRRTA
jgi:hypothetical protein